LQISEMDLIRQGCEGVNWNEMAHNRVQQHYFVNSVTKF